MDWCITIKKQRRNTGSGLYFEWERGTFLARYIGFSQNILSGEQYLAIANDPRVVEMPIYPKQGAIAVIDNVIVVRLG